MEKRMLAFARTLTERVRAAHGDCYIAGGFVRDRVMGNPSKDLDMVVFDFLPELFPALALACPGVKSVIRKGASFEVYGIKTETAGEVEVAFPRRERKNGCGHNGFSVEVDPFMTLEEEAKRRDLTLNAMYMDAVTGDVFDFHGGLAHIRSRLMVPTSPAFREDPLRPMRLLSLASRFGFVVDPSARPYCREVMDEFDTIPASRLWTEWRKWALGKVPSMGLRALEDAGWLGLFPTLEGLAGLAQDPSWHPEGDAWTHTALSADAACAIADRDRLCDDDRVVLVMSALLHDVGKPMTTTFDEDGRIRSRGHDRVGGYAACDFLAQIGAPKQMAAKVVTMVVNHMAFVQRPTASSMRRLARRIAPVSVAELLRLVQADHDARPPNRPGLPKNGRRALTLSRNVGVFKEKRPDILLGRHVLPILKRAGMSPGPLVGSILKVAADAQDSGKFTDEESAVKWLSETFDGIPGNDLPAAVSEMVSALRG